MKGTGFFIIRQHVCTPWQVLEEPVFQGETETGEIWEQRGVVTNPETEKQLSVRRIEIRLKTPTRDGDVTMSLLTNLPTGVGDGDCGFVSQAMVDRGGVSGIGGFTLR